MLTSMEQYNGYRQCPCKPSYLTFLAKFTFRLKSIEGLSIHIVTKFEIFLLIVNIYFLAIFITSYLECCWSCPSKPRTYLVSRVVQCSSCCRTSYIAICISKLIQNMLQLHNSHKICVFTLLCNWHWNCVKPTILSWFKHNLPRRLITSYLQSSKCECSYLPRIAHLYWVKSWNNM